MSEDNGTKAYAQILRIPLRVFGTIMLALGVSFLVAPETTLSVTNDPTLGRVGLFRFLGAWLIGTGLACWSTGENPDRQHPILLMTSLGCGLGAGSLVFMWSGLEYRGDELVIFIAFMILTIFSGLFWWGQIKIGRELYEKSANIRRLPMSILTAPRRPPIGAPWVAARWPETTALDLRSKRTDHRNYRSVPRVYM